MSRKTRFTSIRLSQLDNAQKSATGAISTPRHRERRKVASLRGRFSRRSYVQYTRLALVVTVLAAIGAGVYVVSESGQQVSADMSQRNTAIAQALSKHPVDTVLAQHWRATTLAQRMPSNQATLPLADCTKPYGSPVTAPKVAPDYLRHSFVYLLSLRHDRAGTDCTFEHVSRAYGLPSSITIVSGTISQPKEELLFYDFGAHHFIAKVRAKDDPRSMNTRVSSQTDPSALWTSCGDKPTIMQVVAHEDDDLLFLSPDLLHAIHNGNCVRTVYLTAGDAGSSKFYWLGRERGSEAAYSEMSGATTAWVEHPYKLAANEFATVVAPADNTKLSLIFMHLPDGSPDGRGFRASGYESLGKLAEDHATSIQSVDGQSVYSYDALVAALQNLFDLYHPSEVRTQLPYNNSTMYTDHSDHMAAGQLATAAFTRYQAAHAGVTLAYYPGYPIRQQPVNVTAEDLLEKQQAFFAYSQFDGAVCSSMQSCRARGDYGAYLERQYRTEP